MIYLDNAATSWPKPKTVYQAIDSFLLEKGGNPGRGSHSLARAARDAVEKARMLVARHINTSDYTRIIFTLNCTDALNLGLKGLLKPGDHVITSSIEHNSVVRPLTKLSRQGVNITRLQPSPRNGVVSPQDIKKAITGEMKLLVITHASNVTGIIQPIKEYGEICKKYHILFMVDAAQTAGKQYLDVEENNIDLLAFSGHKGLFGPPGVGVLYIGNGINLDTLREGGSGTKSESEEQPEELPYKFESGTVNSLGISGLGAGINYIESEGLNKIKEYEDNLIDKLIEGLGRIPRIVIYPDEEQVSRVPLVSFNIEGYTPGEVGVILDQIFDIKVRTGLQCAPLAHRSLGTFPMGAVRLSPGYFNTVDEIEITLKFLEEIAGKTNLKDSLSHMKIETETSVN